MLHLTRSAFKVVLLAAASLLMASMPSAALHLFRAQYDETQLIKLKSTVTKINRNNSHVLMSLDVKDDQGKVAGWKLELEPEWLVSQGWKVDSN